MLRTFGAPGVACRWPLAGLSGHGKEIAPLGAPSASSAFFCRLPPRRSGDPMLRAVGAPEDVCYSPFAEEVTTVSWGVFFAPLAL